MTRERSLHVRLIATCALAALPATSDERAELVRIESYMVNYGLGAVLTADLLRDFLGRPVSPDALIADTGRIGG